MKKEKNTKGTLPEGVGQECKFANKDRDIQKTESRAYDGQIQSMAG